MSKNFRQSFDSELHGFCSCVTCRHRRGDGGGGYQRPGRPSVTGAAGGGRCRRPTFNREMSEMRSSMAQKSGKPTGPNALRTLPSIKERPGLTTAHRFNASSSSIAQTGGGGGGGRGRGRGSGSGKCTEAVKDRRTYPYSEGGDRRDPMMWVRLLLVNRGSHCLSKSTTAWTYLLQSLQHKYKRALLSVF